MNRSELIQSLQNRIDVIQYYDAFDSYHIGQGIAAMEKLFARYLNERLDMYLSI